MRQLTKYIVTGLLLAGLAGCDRPSEKSAAADDNGVSASTSTQTVSLMDGKLSFDLPAGMSDKSGKLGSQANNMHVYADESGQRAIIVIESDSTSDGLDVLAQRLQQQQRNRDPQLQMVTNKAITLKGTEAQQLDTVISANNQSAWSSVILAKTNGKLLTMQITLPADDQQQAQTDAENVINTITLK